MQCKGCGVALSPNEVSGYCGLCRLTVHEEPIREQVTPTGRPKRKYMKRKKRA